MESAKLYGEKNILLLQHSWIYQRSWKFKSFFFAFALALTTYFVYDLSSDGINRYLSLSDQLLL